MATKRKTLPKNFEALLEKGDLAALKAVFDACSVDAVGGYAKQTALAFDACPDELARWLVAQGANVNAPDQAGRTPLHHRARSLRASTDVLLELGADVNSLDGSSGTPLHAAADSKNVESARRLLANGAQVDARDARGQTPLECALMTCSNIEIERMASLGRLLIDAGADRSAKTREYVLEIGKRFEFHRERYAKHRVEAVSSSLSALYAVFDVAPVPRRQMHDGVSPITVKSTSWQEQHGELWDLLVPSGGPAATVQGEVIRISGRISHEILDNGAGNWDDAYREMARGLLLHLQNGTGLGAPELAELRVIVDDLIRRRDGDCARMTELAVAWVLRNPKPVALPAPAYNR